MLTAEDIDHHLLFKQLVIIEEDQVTNSSEELIEPQVEQKNVSVETAEKSVPKKIETETPIQEESKELPDQLLICHASQKEQLHSANSNISKICKALGIEDLLKNMISFEEISAEQELHTQKSIWTVGLSTEEQASIDQKSSGIILHSVYTEEQMSKEDKLALYEPIKQFAVQLKAE